jgi:hypothetical protein
MKTKQFPMKTMVILLGFSFLFISCAKDGVSIETTNNSEFKVEELFTNKQCTVYRFQDNGRSHYYTNCTETISSHTENCGKSCTTTIQDNNRTN